MKANAVQTDENYYVNIGHDIDMGLISCFFHKFMWYLFFRLWLSWRLAGDGGQATDHAKWSTCPSRVKFLEVAHFVFFNISRVDIPSRNGKLKRMHGTIHCFDIHNN